MKKIFYTICLLISNLLYSQNQWSDPIWISGGVNPDFDIDPQTGNLHILTMINGATYTKTDPFGNILLQESIPQTGNDLGSWAYGGTIAVDMSGLPHACYRFMTDFPYFENYYINRLTGTWSEPLLIQSRTFRAYMIRMDIDKADRIHIVQTSPVNELEAQFVYRRIKDGVINKIHSWNVAYRVDYRLEIDISGEDYIHIITGCPLYPHGPIIYHRSINNGYSIDNFGDIHAQVCSFRNGHPDIFADESGDVHISYGSTIDESINSYPSIWYVRYEEGVIVQNKRVTQQGWLEEWNNGHGSGLSSVASSDDGKVVAIAYTTKDIGDLYVILSRDRGVTWSVPELLATNVDARPDGRGKHVIRAYQNHFYVIYTQTTNPQEEDLAACSTMLRYLRNVSDEVTVQIQGSVNHYINQLPIPDVTIHWLEGTNVSATTDQTGNFYFSSLPSETNVTLKPYKERYSDFASSPIRSYDAALVARTAVGLMDPFSPEARAAADVDGDGEITMHDAVHIARYAVGFEPPAHIQVSEWKFSPDSLVYDPLMSSMTDQQFTGMLVGDVRGEWTNTKQSNPGIQLSILPITQQDNLISIPIGLNQGDLLSLDLQCDYDTGCLEFISGNISLKMDGFQLHYLEREKGTVHFGLFGPDYYSGKEPILNLTFKLIADKQTSSISIRQIYINDILSENIKIDLTSHAHSSALMLKQNIPNPFNDQTMIYYSIQEETKVRIDIVNTVGQNILTLWDGQQSAGNHQIHWNGKDDQNFIVPSGIYFCRLQTADQVIVRKIAKIR
ncbi:T9SS type A sorting domain-containing protein [bacterium]|nr:T9SS type A sorting domain-containing protein [bacterium]